MDPGKRAWKGRDMVRKLSLAVALVLGITPLGSHAVGLGNIHLNSALNQYFDADIDLLSVEQEEIVDIKVELASPEAFRRSGIDRPFILSKLRFQAEQTQDGKAVIRVSSRDPIREPFLNFLIEVNWPKGKLLREYTVLLDPPATLARKPAPVQQAPMQPRTTQRTAPVQTSRSVVSPADVAWAGSATIEEYGPTRRNDTLWAIASRYRTEGASMTQMMIALQRANPQAFIDQNINKLRTGQILRIPKTDEVLELSRREASNAYRDQLDEWQADSAPVEQVAESGEAPESGAMAPMETTPVAEAELKIASARPSGEGEAGPSEGADDGQVLEQLQQELIASEEAKQAALQEAEVTRSRVEDLEAQLEDLQRLLSLKSDQLAQLQAAADEGMQPVPEPGNEMLEAAGEAIETESPVMVETGDTPDMAISEEQAPVVTDDTVSPVMEEPASPVMESPTEAIPEAITEPAASAEPPAEKPAKPAAPAKEQGLLDMIAGDTTMLGVAVGGIVVLLALLWVAISRRRSSSADFQESILISTVDDTDSEQLTETIPEEPVTHPTEETSFLSDFSPSDIDALQDETGEVDPLAEADVYIAYGRYQQAEELIRQAIEKAPERIELKHKLFEILYATKDKDAFVSLAESASSGGLEQKDPDAWAKVVSMGAKLAADHALFSAAAADQSLLDDDDLASLEDELSLDDELGLDESSTTVGLMEAGGSGGEKEADDTLGSLDMDQSSDFSGLDDLDDLALDSDLNMDDGDSGEIDLGLDLEDSAKTVVSDEQEERFSLDDLDGLDADTDISLVKPEESDEGSDLLDLTLDSLDADESLDEESLSIEDPLESAELDQLKVDAESEAEQLEEGVIDFSDSIQLEEGDSQVFDTLELEQVEDLAEEDSGPDSFSLDDLEQDDDDDSLFHTGDEDDEADAADEVNTKLDLARAYVDMEDADGARSILEEVLKEGNEGQQKAAREMLNQLS